MSLPRAIYAGSFDPLTLGHCDIIVRASKMFDLTIGVANNPDKQHMFSHKNRVNMVKKCYGNNVVSVKGMLAQTCHDLDIEIIVRGLRNVLDFEYEFGMAHVSEDYDIETVFIVSSTQSSYISSSLVRQLFNLNQPIEKYVPETVAKTLSEHPTIG